MGAKSLAGTIFRCRSAELKTTRLRHMAEFLDPYSACARIDLGSGEWGEILLQGGRGVAVSAMNGELIFHGGKYFSFEEVAAANGWIADMTTVRGEVIPA